MGCQAGQVIVFAVDPGLHAMGLLGRARLIVHDRWVARV